MAKQKLPKSLTILGQKWTIKVTKKGLGKNSAGECQPRQNLILIDPSYCYEAQKEILFHELAHAVIATSGLSLILNGFNDNLEEIIIEHLSPVLYGVLKENGLLKY